MIYNPRIESFVYISQDKSALIALPSVTLEVYAYPLGINGRFLNNMCEHESIRTYHMALTADALNHQEPWRENREFLSFGFTDRNGIIKNLFDGSMHDVYLENRGDATIYLDREYARLVPAGLVATDKFLAGNGTTFKYNVPAKIKFESDKFRPSSVPLLEENPANYILELRAMIKYVNIDTTEITLDPEEILYNNSRTYRRIADKKK